MCSQNLICCHITVVNQLIYISFFFRKYRFKYHNCVTETAMQIPKDKILNHATLVLVVSLTVLISTSLRDYNPKPKKLGERKLRVKKGKHKIKATQLDASKYSNNLPALEIQQIFMDSLHCSFKLFQLKLNTLCNQNQGMKTQ